MWLILCSSSDTAALWAHRGLESLGLVPVYLLTSESLASVVHWEHRLGSDGLDRDHVALTLAASQHAGSPLKLDSTNLRGVLNRLFSAPHEHLLVARPDEREYATQELSAFYLSWLHALPCPVLNRPTPQGLAGQWRHLSEWVWLAARAGLPTPTYQLAPDPSGGPHALDPQAAYQSRLVAPDVQVRTVLVVMGRVVGPDDMPIDIEEGCQRLARLAGTELLGFDFTGKEWTFAGATPWPDLRVRGQELLGALADALQGKRGRET